MVYGSTSETANSPRWNLRSHPLCLLRATSRPASLLRADLLGRSGGLLGSGLLGSGLLGRSNRCLGGILVLLYQIGGVSHVGRGLPGVRVVGEALPLDVVQELLSLALGVNDSLDLVLGILLLLVLLLGSASLATALGTSRLLRGLLTGDADH